jgi:hypothetical protein
MACCFCNLRVTDLMTPKTCVRQDFLARADNVVSIPPIISSMNGLDIIEGTFTFLFWISNENFSYEIGLFHRNVMYREATRRYSLTNSRYIDFFPVLENFVVCLVVRIIQYGFQFLFLVHPTTHSIAPLLFIVTCIPLINYRRPTVPL